MEHKDEKKIRKGSIQTNENMMEDVGKDLKQSTVTVGSVRPYDEQDIGCFLNIEQVESPMLEFEDLLVIF